MAKEGFAIHCPHCQRWSCWEEHPDKKVLESPAELKLILDKMDEAVSQGKQKDFAHNKLLRCQSSPRFCPASFEAYICRGGENLLKYSEIVKSWSFKRHFRLYKLNKQERWDEENQSRYCCVLFNTQPTVRQRYIELESLMDRELVSRLIAGVCMEIDLPLTFFSANIFESKKNNGDVEVYWMPIEGYSQKERLVPPRFNLFCKKCREISMKNLEKDFYKNHPIDKCIFNKDGKCGGRQGVAACLRNPIDWNHCLIFVEERKKKCPCYNSDVTLIRNIENKWRQRVVPEKGILHRCHAGFWEVAFPIEVHNHLVGVAMTGQVFFDQNKVKHAKDFIKSKKVSDVDNIQWDTLTGEDDKLEVARQILVGLELKNREDGTPKFLMDKQRLEKKIERLMPNLKRFEETAESHYRDFRVKAEFAFRQELLGFIENHKTEPDFFNKRVSDILKRMQEFWAFKGAFLLKYSFSTKIVSTIAQSILGKADPFGFPGRNETNVEIDEQEIHPCPFLHRKAEKPPFDSPLSNFIPVIDNIVEGFDLEVADGDYEFIVVVPTYQEIYVFVFVVRDKEAVDILKPLDFDSLSDLCRDAIFETCSEVIHKFNDVKVLSEQHTQVHMDGLQKLENEIEEEIKIKVSLPVDTLLEEELIEDSGLSDVLKRNLSEAKERYNKVIPIIEKRFKKELEKLKSNA